MFSKGDKRLQRKPKNKYGARKTLCSLGHPHPSGLEASVCEVLSLRLKAGDIRNLKYIATVKLGYGISWKLDFSFEQSPDWHLRYAEAKGAETRDYKLKLRMYREGCGEAPLEIWKGNARRPMLVQTVYPKAKGEA